MTDLISKVNELEPEVINDLKKKYESILSISNVNEKENVQYFLYVIDLSVNYIKEKYNNESVMWKALAVLLAKKLIIQKRIETKDDLFKYIDQFFEFKKSEYDNYMSNIVSYSDEFQKNLGFIFKFISSLK